ncbi:MAG: hypothetical protein C0614_03895 [Desulfuromonas sp.]|nr:MAG: hypothetical protein C0614_03895 [Desulfuromonas sp.]
MKTILMVDDEHPFLLSLKDGMTAHNPELNILLANNGQEALDTMQQNEIDLLVTDLKMPGMDGFQLLAHVSRSAPYLPIIVMTAFGTPDIEEQLSNMTALHYLEKPLDFDVLATTIDSALNSKSNSYIRGITLATFLQLVHMEKKSCSPTIRSRSGSGQLHIRQGDLINASCNGMTGKQAALEIIGWDNTEIEMDATCRCEEKIITDPLGFILMEAHRIKDEGGLGTEVDPFADLLTSDNDESIKETREETALSGFLLSNREIKEFAIFKEENQIEQINPPNCSLETMDPGYYLSTCNQVGSIFDNSRLNYLLYTTTQNNRYMMFQWPNRRAILSLEESAKPDKLFSEVIEQIQCDSSFQ